MANNMSLDALKNHLFETLEGIKNLSDPEASENEKISIDQAKQIVDVSDAIIDIFKVQLDAAKTFATMDDVANPAKLMVGMGFSNESNMKMIE